MQITEIEEERNKLLGLLREDEWESGVRIEEDMV